MSRSPSLLTLCALLSACTADLGLHAGRSPDEGASASSDVDGDPDESWISSAIDGVEDKHKLPADAGSPWQAAPDAAAPRPGDSWGEPAGDGVAQPFDGLGPSPCYLRTDGAVLCWGENTEGQLGNGSFGGVNGAPSQTDDWGEVSGLTSVTSVVVTPLSRCALREDGNVWCWGSEGSFRSAVPVQVLGIEGNAVGLAQYDEEYGAHLLVIMANGQVNEIDLWLAHPDYPPGTSLFSASAGPLSSWDIDPYNGWYGVNEAHALWRDTGFLPRLEGDDSPRPPELFSIAGVTRVRVEQNSPLDGGAGLALLSDGTVACWGMCPLGDPDGLTFKRWSEATPIPELTNVRDLVGPRCVVDTSDVVWCWGEGFFAKDDSLYTRATRAGYLPGLKALTFDDAGRPVEGLNDAGEIHAIVWR